MSNQKANEYLKIIASSAKLNDQVLLHSTIGNSRQEDVFYKWQLVSTHTARRSYATNEYLEGKSPMEVKMTTGHQTEKSFLKYIRLTPEENARRMIDHALDIQNSEKVDTVEAKKKPAGNALKDSKNQTVQ
ncbi:MAG: hypothetical protein WC865_12060 [Bacteroidales bacterium]